MALLLSQSWTFRLAHLPKKRRIHFMNYLPRQQHYNKSSCMGPLAMKMACCFFLNNRSVRELILDRVGFQGAIGGAILSTLLRINWHLQALDCIGLPLGVPGARALQPALRFNQTMTTMSLVGCGLGDEGLLVVVDALGENNTLKKLYLQNNRITLNGLPHVTQLLQRDTLTRIHVSCNRGLFDHEENTRIFSSALSETTTLVGLALNNCRLPVQAITSLFQVVANIPTLRFLYIWDEAQLQGPSLERLRDIIPDMQNLQRLRVNLDFMDASTLSCFHRNTSIQHMYTYSHLPDPEITTGPISIILERNRRLYQANTLLSREQPQRRRRTVSLGLWASGVGRLARDNAGATATYTILREKLVHWWAPTGPTTTTAPATSRRRSRRP